jgi:diguanylate cyclase (GGDEF)-like protein
MRTVVRRRNLGDRMIAVVGMLVGAAVTAVIGFAVLVADRVDRDSAEREVALARTGVVELTERMQADLAAFARWDDAVKHASASGISSWMHRHVGQRLHAGGHNRTYVLNHKNQQIYAAIEGMADDGYAYGFVHAKLDALVRAVRDAHANDTRYGASFTDDGELEPPSEPKIETAFRRIEGRPALVGVTTIVPSLVRAQSAESDPAVVVSVAFLQPSLLRRLADNLGAERIEIVPGLPPADRLSMQLPLGPGEEPAWLVWKARAPGAAMLLRLLPALVSVVGLLGIVTFLVLVYMRRTTERLKHSERRATELAYRDRLTGLPNRIKLLETLSGLSSTGLEKRVALALIDLDDFKDINDTLGHSTGDEVLFDVGERLMGIAGEDGMAVRFGGDEFALLMPVGPGNDDLFAIGRRICDVMRAPAAAGGQMLAVSATVGVAVAPEDATEAEQLMRRAEIALYRAKAESRNGYRLFNPSYEEALQRRSAVERELARAIANEELSLQFQPLFAADGERMVAIETLVRWKHPERGIVPPSEFIPVAEQTGLVVKIDEWVLRHACLQARKWPGLSLAVNLSATNFRQPHVAERLTRVLNEIGFDPRRLEIEITESMLLGATGEVLGELSELRRLGVRIALDDFGTGYSSLGYLRRFPVDKLKIDKSFVQNLGITEDAAAIVECVSRLGRALGLAVTAEGVESSEQHRFVRAVGCHQVQGYLFSPPVEAERISEMLQAGMPVIARQRHPRLAIA